MTTFEKDEKQFSHEKSLGLVKPVNFFMRPFTSHLLSQLCIIQDLTPSQMIEKLIIQEISSHMQKSDITWPDLKIPQ